MSGRAVRIIWDSNVPGPASEDFVIIDDTWHGISVHVIDGMESESGFESVDDAAEWALDAMDRARFWTDLWVQHDRGEPYLYVSEREASR